MNYFNKVEKTLKSCLKEKLSITTATVVGFLIAGTVAFGSEMLPLTIMLDGKGTAEQPFTYEGNGAKVNITNSPNVILTGKLGGEGAIYEADDTRIVTIGDNNGTVTNRATIQGRTGISISTGKNTEDVKTLINEGDIIANKYGIYSNGHYQGYGSVITNKGNIKIVDVTSNNSVSGDVYGVYTAGKTIFTNEKGATIDVNVSNNKGATLVAGARIHDGITGVNNGDIIVKSTQGKEKSATTIKDLLGVYVSGVNSDTSFENNGNITVEGDNATGLVLAHQEKLYPSAEKGKKISAVNGESGNITVTGKDAVGVQMSFGKNASEPFTNPANPEEKYTSLEFTNKGTIAVKGNEAHATSMERWGQTGVLIGLGNDNHDNSGTQVKGDVVFTNEGRIEAPLGVEFDGFYNQDMKGKVSIVNKGEIVVNDYINSKYAGQDNWIRNGAIYAAGVGLNDGQRASVENYGKLAMELNDEQAKEINGIEGVSLPKNLHTLRVHADTDAINKAGGEISVKYTGETALDGMAAVAVTSEQNYDAKFTNEGTITAEGLGVHGIYVRNKGGKDGIVEVTNNGEIRVSGKDAVAIYVQDGEIGVASGTGKTTITNEKDGKIYVGSGATAISVNNSNNFVSDISNKGLISLADTIYGDDQQVSTLLSGGELVNYGTIALEDRTSLTQDEWNTILNAKEGALVTNNGKLTNYGMITDKAGNSLFAGGTEIGDSTVEDLVNGSITEGGLKVGENGATITGSKDTEGNNMVLETPVINVEGGNLTLATTKDGAGVAIDSENINIENGRALTTNTKGHSVDSNIVLNGNGKIVVKSSGGLALTGSVSQGTGEGATITNNGELLLTGANVGVDIIETNQTSKSTIVANGSNSVNNVTAKEMIINSGDTTFNGDIKVGSITISDTTPSPLANNSDKELANGYFTANSKFTKTDESGTTINSQSGTAIFEITDEGNALSNSTGKVTVTGNIDFDYSGLTEDKTISLRGQNGETEVDHDLSQAEYDKANDGVYKVELDKTNDTLTLKYDTEYLSSYGSELNSINNGFQIINDKVTAMVGESKEARASLADRVYGNTIYGETTRVAYENSKLIEDSILSLETENKVGEWTANGKAIYSKNEYDRGGKLKDYSSEIESVGLMATFEYGLNETTSTGFAFGGVKQDLDSDNGNADGDAFYLGVFANKTLGNNKFTAGLGYQLDKFEADEKIFGGDDKYDSTAISGYVQAKHIFNLGNSLTVEPKAKFGYTYVDQDSVKDGTYKVDSQDIGVFDLELGTDLVKSYAIKDGKVDLTLGLAYVRTMGDTDEELSAKFYNGNRDGKSFDILGAELSENTGKFDLSVEVTKDNGFFYNGGLNLSVGSDDYRNYGVNVGVGYKF